MDLKTSLPPTTAFDLERIPPRLFSVCRSSYLRLNILGNFAKANPQPVLYGPVGIDAMHSAKNLSKVSVS